MVAHMVASLFSLFFLLESVKTHGLDDTPIVITDIDKHTASDLQLAALMNRRVILDSGGGTVAGGMAARDVIKTHNIPLHVETCLSACTFLMSASPQVEIATSARVGVHFAHKHIGEQRVLFLWEDTRTIWNTLTGQDTLFETYVNHMVDRRFFTTPPQEDFVLIEDHMFSIPTLASYWFLTPDDIITHFTTTQFVFQTTPEDA